MEKQSIWKGQGWFEEQAGAEKGSPVREPLKLPAKAPWISSILQAP